MRCKRRCGCGARSENAGCFFIAVGCGVFLAYAIPRYVLMTLLGAGLIGVGICIMLRKH